MKPVHNSGRRRGQALAEFAFAAFSVLIIVIGTVDVARFLFTWSTLADGTRAGVRYAAVHGGNRTDCDGCSPADGPSSGSDTSDIVAAVHRITGAAGFPDDAVSVTVYYAGDNSVNKTVKVTAAYGYQSLDPIIDLTRTISSTSEGTICF